MLEQIECEVLSLCKRMAPLLIRNCEDLCLKSSGVVTNILQMNIPLFAKTCDFYYLCQDKQFSQLNAFLAVTATY